MPDVTYLVAGVVVAGLITLGLRALPFAILKPLRKSKFVQALGRWMPAGIMLILAVVVLRDELVARPNQVWAVLAATAVTVAVHLLCKRRALLSIAAGTTCYVLLLNLL
ncbi:branched-chain amino acid transporter permease [Leucobacter chromiireducens]|uniref:Branched-chain amino acid transporter AzlD n=1 Tax=Leucobacter chromiireducens subsp. chromiireducens TaxID=660067 RepID=A0ABS1SQX5_9MICO|nr:AzlD domain-containing protein [Leucobacter chromiireducens]MBL3689286.1 branched-chain amino acid transporter AzlD [Leucobacter chromiireducens subsp. chromiireducens]